MAHAVDPKHITAANPYMTMSTHETKMTTLGRVSWKLSLPSLNRPPNMAPQSPNLQKPPKYSPLQKEKRDGGARA